MIVGSSSTGCGRRWTTFRFVHRSDHFGRAWEFSVCASSGCATVMQGERVYWWLVVCISGPWLKPIKSWLETTQRQGLQESKGHTSRRQKWLQDKHQPGVHSVIVQEKGEPALIDDKPNRWVENFAFQVHCEVLARIQAYWALQFYQASSWQWWAPWRLHYDWFQGETGRGFCGENEGNKHALVTVSAATAFFGCIFIIKKNFRSREDFPGHLCCWLRSQKWNSRPTIGCTQVSFLWKLQCTDVTWSAHTLPESEQLCAC